MTIQDMILTVGSLMFAFALLPTVLGASKPERATSAISGTILVVFSGVYISLELWFSAAATFMTAILWYVLLAQKMQQSRKLR